jgi:hypothetical protein
MCSHFTVLLAPLGNHLSARLLLAIGPLVKIGNLCGAPNFSGYVTERRQGNL